MKDTDHKKSINIAIKSILDAMQTGKEEIFSITEQIEKENKRVNIDISDIKKIIQNHIKEIEELKLKEKNSRIILSEVSSNFEKYTPDDIKNSYYEALSLQETLFEKQFDMDKILKNLESFEGRIQKNNELVAKADQLLNRIEIMSNYIQIDTSTQQDSDDLFGKWMIFQENEKSRIARDIHDGPAQTMASLVMKSDIIKKLVERQSPNETIYKELEQLKIHLRGVIKEIRKIMYDLRPTSLDEIGILPSIDGLISKIKEDYDIEFEKNINQESDIKSSTTKIICFRIIQESFNNIIKHSKANKVLVGIDINENNIKIVVKDNGVGFDINLLKTKESFGLSSLKERVSLVEGTVNISSKVNKGTTITVYIPNKGDVYAK